MPIEDIETLKSYFKRQQERDLSFRAECKKENFYLAARNNQDKWAWIGAIERVIDKKQTRVFNGKAEGVYDPVRVKLDGNAGLEEFYERGLKREKGIKHVKNEEAEGEEKVKEVAKEEKEEEREKREDTKGQKVE